MDITVTVECTRDFTHRPDDAELARLCGLIKDGIGQYWSRDITKDDGSTWQVTVSVQEASSGDRKKIVIKTYDEEPFVSDFSR